MIISHLFSPEKTGPRNGIAKAKMPEDSLMRLETEADVTKRVASCKLSEKQMKEQVVTRQIPDMPVAIVFLNGTVRPVYCNAVHYLSENAANCVYTLAAFDSKGTPSIQIKKIKEHSETLICKGIYVVKSNFIASPITAKQKVIFRLVKACKAVSLNEEIKTVMDLLAESSR